MKEELKFKTTWPKARWGHFACLVRRQNSLYFCPKSEITSIDITSRQGKFFTAKRSPATLVPYFTWRFQSVSWTFNLLGELLTVGRLSNCVAFILNPSLSQFSRFEVAFSFFSFFFCFHGWLTDQLSVVIAKVYSPSESKPLLTWQDKTLRFAWKKCYRNLLSSIYCSKSKRIRVNRIKISSAKLETVV